MKINKNNRFIFITILFELISLMKINEKRKLLFLQALVLISAIIETLSIIILIPFINLLFTYSEPLSGIFKNLYILLNFNSKTSFIILIAIIITFFLILSFLISSLRIWLLISFANRFGFSIGDRLLAQYMSYELSEHLASDSSYRIKQIAVETIRIKNLIKAYIQIFSDLFLFFFMVIGMFIIQPYASLLAFSSILIIYLLLSVITRPILQKNGIKISIYSDLRLRTIKESLIGIKDVLINQAENYFVDRMKRSGDELTFVNTVNQTIPQILSKFIQTIVYVLLIFIASILIWQTQDGPSLLLLIGTFFIGGMKIIPIIQNIYNNISTIYGNANALSLVSTDLKGFNQKKYRSESNHLITINNLELENVSFSYNKKSNSCLSNINLNFKKGEIIGITGLSGSGKSTLMNVIAGLLNPVSGKIIANGEEINDENIFSYRSQIALVHQDIFLLNSNIRSNIAFGVNEADINFERVLWASKHSKILSFIETLEDGFDTIIGENGVLLSGGQCQRLAYARALYKNASILLLDEATSALDTHTEKNLIKEINEFSNDYIILIVTHRKSALKYCNKIYDLYNGMLVKC